MGGIDITPIVDLVYWRDPKKTGIVFGTIMVVLLSLTYFSLISVVAYLSLAILTATFSFRIYKSILSAVQKSNEGHPFQQYIEQDISLSREQVHELSDTVVAHVNATVIELRRLILVEDLVDSIKFGVMLWALTYIGAWFNGMTLVILSFVAAFTLPKVYETNKEQIDHYLGLVQSNVNDIMSKVKAKIPIGKKPKEQ